MKLIYLVIDKLSEWLEGDPYRLAALALVPVGALVGASIANKEIGYTIYSWGAYHSKLNRKSTKPLLSAGRVPATFFFMQSTVKVL